jgi:hypothetical protein
MVMPRSVTSRQATKKTQRPVISVSLLRHIRWRSGFQEWNASALPSIVPSPVMDTCRWPTV